MNLLKLITLLNMITIINGSLNESSLPFEFLRGAKPTDQYKDSVVVRNAKPTDQYKDSVVVRNAK